MTVGKFTAFFFQKGSADLSLPGTEAGDPASYGDWEDEDGNKC